MKTWSCSWAVGTSSRDYFYPMKRLISLSRDCIIIVITPLTVTYWRITKFKVLPTRCLLREWGVMVEKERYRLFLLWDANSCFTVSRTAHAAWRPGYNSNKTKLDLYLHFPATRLSSADNLQTSAGWHRDSSDLDFNSSTHCCELSNLGLRSFHTEHADEDVRR